MAVQSLRRRIFMEGALAASRLEGGEIRAAVRHGIERVVVAVEPRGGPAIADAAFEQLVVDAARTPAARAEPTADEVDDGTRHAGLAAAPGYGEDAAAR